MRQLKFVSSTITNYLWNSKIKPLIDQKADVGHTHDKVNGYKVVVSNTVPTVDDSSIITVYVPEASNNRVAALNAGLRSRIITSSIPVIEEPMISEDYLEEDDTILLSSTPVEVPELRNSPPVTEVTERILEDPVDSDFILSVLEDVDEYDDVVTTTTTSISSALSTGIELGSYTIEFSSYALLDGDIVDVPEAEYQLERNDGYVLKPKSPENSYSAILLPAMKLNLTTYHDFGEFDTPVKLPGIEFPVVTMQKNGRDLAKTYEVNNTLEQLTMLTWLTNKSTNDIVDIKMSTLDAEDTPLYLTASIHRILNAEKVLRVQYATVDDLIDAFEFDDYGLWDKYNYTTSDGYAIYELHMEYLRDDPNVLHYLIDITTLDDVKLYMIIELHRR